MVAHLQCPGIPRGGAMSLLVTEVSAVQKCQHEKYSVHHLHVAEECGK